jgi:hypothetical protein
VSSEFPRRRWSDASRIDLIDPQERVFWTKFFGVEEEELFKAVDKVGTSAEKVRRYLERENLSDWVFGGRSEERRQQAPSRRNFE